MRILKKTSQNLLIHLTLIFSFSLAPHALAEHYSPKNNKFLHELTIPKSEKQKLFDFARFMRINDSTNANKIIFTENTRKITMPLIITLFDDDGKIVFMKKNNDINSNILEKISATAKQIPKKHLDAYLHIQVVSYIGKFPNFGIKGLFDNKVYEPHVTGLTYELDGQREELLPLVSLKKNLTAKSARSFLAKKMDIDAKKMPGMNDLSIEIFRTIHFGESYPDRKFTDFFRGHKVFTVDDLNKEALEQRIQLIGQWYSNNVKGGEVTYQFSPKKNLYYDSNRTMVRSTMSVWVLNRLAFYLNDPKLKKLGQEAIDFYFERLLNMEESLRAGELKPSTKPYGRGDLLENRWSSAGFLIAAILERGEHQKYKKEIDIVFNWIKRYQKDDGVFWTQWGQSQYFMPGQILLSISYLYEQTGDEKYRDFFDKSFAAYEAPLFHMIHLGPKTYSPYAPAWFTQPLAKMYELTKDNKYRDVIYEINDNVIKWHKLNFEYSAYFDYEGNLEAKPGFNGNNSITSASLESLCDAAFTAKSDGDIKRLHSYQAGIKHATAYLLRLQFIPENTYYFKNKRVATGGFKKDIINSFLWMDNVWHLTSAFMKIQKNDLLKSGMF